MARSRSSTSSPETSSNRCLRRTSETSVHTPLVERYAPVLVLITAFDCPQLLVTAPDWMVTPVERLLEVKIRKPPETRQLAEWFTPARRESTDDRSEKTNEPCRALVCAWYPSATEAAPLAVLSSPAAKEDTCAAVERRPNAVALSPLARTSWPIATEYAPMLAASHCVPLIPPARNAAFRGYHTMRVPAPSAGMPLPEMSPS